MKEPRLFENDDDLRAMQALVSEGILARSGTRYIHPGDLAWWYYYTEAESAIRQNTYLWYGAHTLQAWAMISPGWQTVDLFVRPFLLGSSEHRKLLEWTIVKASEFSLENGKDKFSTLWIAQDDALINQMLCEYGFEMDGETMVTLTRSLDNEIPDSRLPEGFTLRSCKGLVEVEQRAMVQYHSFGSERAVESYIDRWRKFMQSPVYDPDLDIVAVASDGRLASFCILWEDRANRIGYFEPVGTDPDFQRMGLGRAIMHEGLRRLKARGMKSAWVNTEKGMPKAISLYQSCGFKAWHWLVRWTKQIEQLEQQPVELPVLQFPAMMSK